MNVKAYISVEVRDRNGQLTHFKKQEANSFVRSMIDILCYLLGGARPTNGMLDVTNTPRTAGTTVNQPYLMSALLNDGVYGIVVGTGSNPVAVTQYALQTKIDQGAGAGQLVHQAVTYPDNPTTSGSTRYLTVQRILQNMSGNSITVNEVGIYVSYGGTPWYLMIDRTLNTFTITNGSTATVKYTMGVTV